MGEIGDHHRDVRNYKRRQRTARRQRHREDKIAQKPNNDDSHSNGHTSSSSSSSKENDDNRHGNSKAKNSSHQRCWDWMFVGGTSHYAKNRSSFSTYSRAPCRIGSTRILGVGTVKLETVRRPEDHDRQQQGQQGQQGHTYTLELENVLHIPEAVCNGISITPEFMIKHGLQMDWRESLLYKADTGEPWFYGRMYRGLPRVVLAGDPHGASYLEEDVDYMLSVYAGDDQLHELERRVASKI